ncbi:peptidase family M13 [Necator americanus]|uniref:Peptidase family M13 n=1 Tax=Necator americanus TaxID=51031 RepID=W2SXE3_NECAM|nr:peptidase family M13 [Necator americanus]ETN74275.1 peptidase family M13 [Necator americanus]
MNKEELNAIGSRQLLKRIKNYGVWPILDGDHKWRVEDFDLTSLLAHVAERVDVFTKNYVDFDCWNVSRKLIKVPGTGFNVNGKLTQGENIADNGGVRQAFRAYKNYLRKHGEEKRIKGFEKYSNEQIFFLGFALSWCGHTTHDHMINLLLTDPHSPDRFRVNQVLANQPEFAAAYQCDVGTPMNPVERCAVW